MALLVTAEIFFACDPFGDRTLRGAVIDCSSTAPNLSSKNNNYKIRIYLMRKIRMLKKNLEASL